MRAGSTNGEPKSVKSHMVIAFWATFVKVLGSEHTSTEKPSGSFYVLYASSPKDVCAKKIILLKIPGNTI